MMNWRIRQRKDLTRHMWRRVMGDHRGWGHCITLPLPGSIYFQNLFRYAIVDGQNLRDNLTLASLIFGGLGVACWPLVPKFTGSNPAEAIGFLRAKKILSTPSFGGEVKPSVPCCRFAACKRSLKWRGSRHFGKITGQHSRPQFHLPPLVSLMSWRTWRHLVVKSGNI